MFNKLKANSPRDGKRWVSNNERPNIQARILQWTNIGWFNIDCSHNVYRSFWHLNEGAECSDGSWFRDKPVKSVRMQPWYWRNAEYTHCCIWRAGNTAKTILREWEWVIPSRKQSNLTRSMARTRRRRYIVQLRHTSLTAAPSQRIHLKYFQLQIENVVKNEKSDIPIGMPHNLE